jgi:hypothetical protein
MFISSRFEQPINAESPIVVRPSGRLIEVKAVQYWKAAYLISVTPDGIFMVVSFEQSQNALSPILVTLFGKDKVVRLVHSLKA